MSEQVPVVDDVVQVTIGAPPEHWKIIENALVVKLLGLEVIAEFEQFEDKVPGNDAVVLGPFSW